MIVHFTEESAAAFWVMNCQPASHWKTEDWYRPDDVVAENQLAKLHRFANTLGDAKEGPDGSKLRAFKGGAYSLKKDLADRALAMVEHYRKLAATDGKGALLPLHFAELHAALKGDPLPTLDDTMDPADVEELARLRGENAPTEAAAD